MDQYGTIISCNSMSWGYCPKKAGRARPLIGLPSQVGTNHGDEPPHHGGTSLIGLSHGKSHRSKGMMIGGTPMTQETTIYTSNTMNYMNTPCTVGDLVATTSRRLIQSPRRISQVWC